MSSRSWSRPLSGLLFGLLAVLASVGCETNATPFSGLTASLPPEPVIDLSAEAGVPVNPSGPAILPSEVSPGKVFGSRQDPFRLLALEAEYDLAQRTEFFLGEVGGWTPPTNLGSLLEDEVREFIEPVPAWRLSGVIIGNGVLALLDTGLTVHEVRPGMKVPDSEWTVVSIDADRAVLRREGNKLPREFAVNMQGPIGGARPAGGGVAGPAGAGGLPGFGGGAAAGPDQDDDRD
ncbi:MAG: hypothetical protein IH945_01630 [Armatimonadetes bacterium]|nr:hypothetical protein [Armatimonadota bacterium]